MTRPSPTKATRPLFALAVILASALSVNAAPIITPVGQANFRSLVFDSQFNVVSWTLTGSWTNVAIAASLTSSTAGRTGSAYLTNQIGPGTTIANQIATTGFTFAQVGNAFDVSYVNLLSGLTLGPGTYYLVLASANTVSDSGISGGSGVTYSTAAGVSVGPMQLSNIVNAGFPPASTGISTSTVGNRFFTVNGDPVPEPSTVFLFGGGLLAFAALRLRSRRLG